jgi:hypothetical protein
MSRRFSVAIALLVSGLVRLTVVWAYFGPELVTKQNLQAGQIVAALLTTMQLAVVATVFYAARRWRLPTEER